MDIMIIDKDSETVKKIRCLLEENNDTVIEVKTVDEGFGILSSQKIDAIIMDIVIPDGKGLDLFVKLRKHNIPVISLSDLCKQAVISGYLNSMGIVGFVQKPFNQKNFLFAINRIKSSVYHS